MVLLWRSIYLCYSKSSTLNENSFGDQRSFLNIKIKDENIVYSTLERDIFQHSRGHGLKNVPGGEPSDPQFLLTPFAYCISLSLPTSLSPFNMMLFLAPSRNGKMIAIVPSILSISNHYLSHCYSVPAIRLLISIVIVLVGPRCWFSCLF